MLWPNSKFLISLRPAYINQFNMPDLALSKNIFRNNFCILACLYFSLSTSFFFGALSSRTTTTTTTTTTTIK